MIGTRRGALPYAFAGVPMPLSPYRRIRLRDVHFSCRACVGQFFKRQIAMPRFGENLNEAAPIFNRDGAPNFPTGNRRNILVAERSR